MTKDQKQKIIEALELGLDYAEIEEFVLDVVIIKEALEIAKGLVCE